MFPQKISSILFSIISILLINSNSINAFYLPGVAPTNYKENDKIDLLVNHILLLLEKKIQIQKLIYIHMIIISQDFIFVNLKMALKNNQNL